MTLSVTNMNVSASVLIAAVHRRRPLWDPHDVHHHNRVVVNGLWQEVGAEIGLNMVAVKSKWRGLRDYYRQLRRNTDTTDDARYHSSWAHYDEMSFLDETMPLKRSGVTGVVMKKEVPSPEINSNDVADQNWENVWVDPLQSGNPTYPKYADSETSEQDDDDLHFFKSLLPDVRNLTRPKKAFIRLRIQELIFKEVYGGAKIDSNRGSSQEEEG